jgi:hypothetical protein
MADDEYQQWTFTQTELRFLLGAFAPAFLLGMMDPYFGWEIGRRRRSMREAAESLHRRDLTGPTQAAGCSRLGAALAVCAHAGHSLMVTAHNAGCAQTRRNYHFGADILVEHQNLDAERQILTVLPGREAVCDRLTHELRMDAGYPAAGESFAVRESSFFEANRMYRRGEPDSAGKILASAGVDDPWLETLADALRSPESNASVISIHYRGNAGNPVIDGWGLLESAGRIWILRPAAMESRRITQWIPVDAAEIRAALRGMMP